MKAIKIILPIIVVAAIVVCIVIFSKQKNCDTCGRSLEECTCIGSTIDLNNPFIVEIEQEIDKIDSYPDSKFCKEDYYDNIVYKIEEGHKNSRLGKDGDNDRNKKLLSQKLYRKYVPKFVNQAYFVFNGSNWKNDDINFIRDEVKRLQEDSFYTTDGIAYESQFKDFQNIRKQYNVIVSFISKCNKYEYTKMELVEVFPVEEVSKMIAQSKKYEQNNLGNEYVNKCNWLHNRLKEVPKTLFDSHVRYFDNKINYWSGKYTDSIYTSHVDYSEKLYDFLDTELNEFDNSVYKIKDEIFNKEYNRLKERWGKDTEAAYSYFEMKEEKEMEKKRIQDSIDYQKNYMGY